MLTLVNDNLMALLSSLGFENQPGGNDEIVIDRFDHWKNPDSPAILATTCTCGAHFGYADEAAA